jgi:hypothetical protein
LPVGRDSVVVVGVVDPGSVTVVVHCPFLRSFTTCCESTFLRKVLKSLVRFVAGVLLAEVV